MKTKIGFEKCRTEHGEVICGKLPAGAVLQVDSDDYGYSVVTAKQEASIWSRMCSGRFLAVRDLYHFDDCHTELIKHAIAHDLLGKPLFLPIHPHSDHVRIVMTAMVRHEFDFENYELANALLEYLLSIQGIDETFINRFAWNFFGILGPNDAVAEIREQYRRTQVPREHAAKLDQELARKSPSTDDTQPLKI